MGHTADGYLLEKGRIRAHSTFPKIAWTHLLTGFLKPSVPFLYPWHGRRHECQAAIVTNLNQFLCVSLLVPPRGVIRPPIPPSQWASPHLSTQFPCCHSLPAKAKKPGIERLHSSRGAKCLPPSRRFKPQSLRVASNETHLLQVRSFPAHAPNVVAMHSGKQTHSEGQCR